MRNVNICKATETPLLCIIHKQLNAQYIQSRSVGWGRAGAGTVVVAHLSKSQGMPLTLAAACRFFTINSRKFSHCGAFCTVLWSTNCTFKFTSGFPILLPVKHPTTTTTTVLRPFVRDNPGEPVPEDTFTHPPSWTSNVYQLLPSTTIHSIFPVQITCLAIFFAQRLSMSSFVYLLVWSPPPHIHTFLHTIIVFFSQHTLIPSQPVLL